ADPPPRRADADRQAPGHRVLAQELAREAARGRGPRGDHRLDRGERRSRGGRVRAQRNDSARPRRPRARRGAYSRGGGAAVTAVIELAGLEVPGRHGVEEEERQSEQPFLYDIRLELPEPKSDRIEDTVDYRDVVELLREIS